MVLVLYLLLFICGFLIPILVLVFALFNIAADFLGAPYVATSSKVIDEILKGSDLKKGDKFYELGCGDGRVTRTAVKFYQVSGVGIDLNPLLIFYAKALAKFSNLKNIKFLTKNLFDISYQKADVMFLFLLPRTLKKLKSKILNECKKGTLIIAHGFKIEGWEKYLVKTQKRKVFSTYFYEI